MRSRADVVLVFILVLALVGAPIWIVASSQAFRQCILYSSRDVGQNLFVVAYHWLRIGTDCTGKLANDNQGAASAVAGGVGVIVAIAVMFVYRRQATLMDLQARTMERQAGIMERQADITERQENLQRAWLIAGMGDIYHYERDDKKAFDDKDPFKEAYLMGPHGRPLVYCNPDFRNYGQTPAFVRYLEYGFCPDPPPQEPNWQSCQRFEIKLDRHLPKTRAHRSEAVTRNAGDGEDHLLWALALSRCPQATALLWLYLPLAQRWT